MSKIASGIADTLGKGGFHMAALPEQTDPAEGVKTLEKPVP